MIHQNEIYAAMVKSVDDSLGKLQATLVDLGIEENTLIIFTSDNGAVGKQKTASDALYASQSIDLRGEKSLIYEGGIRVPQFMVWQGEIEPAEVDEPVIGTDFYPTLLSVAGLQALADNPQDGVDLSPLFDGGRIDRTQLTFFMPHYMGLAGDAVIHAHLVHIHDCFSSNWHPWVAFCSPCGHRSSILRNLGGCPLNFST